jgi:hypothetical protein
MGTYGDSDYDDDEMVPVPVEAADLMARHLQEVLAQDPALAGYDYPDGGVRVRVDLDDDGRAHVGFAMEAPVFEVFTRLMESGELGTPFDWV